jgi:hypothetical protein
MTPQPIEIPAGEKAAAAQMLQEMRQKYLAQLKKNLRAAGLLLTEQDEQALANIVPLIFREAIDCWLRGYLRGNADAGDLVRQLADPQYQSLRRKVTVQMIGEELPNYARGMVMDYCALFDVPYPEGEISPFG